MFVFFTRNKSESDPAKKLGSILSVMVSESVDKAEKARSGQRHHFSADDKTIESWKLNHPWLIVLQTDTGIRLKCSVCSEFVLRLKLVAYEPEKILVMCRKTVLPVILKAVNTANVRVYNRKYVQSLHDHHTAKLKSSKVLQICHNYVDKQCS